MPYEFGKQLNYGKAGEWVMRHYHLPFYEITKTKRRGEKEGYDFFFCRNGREWKVEVKTDFLCQKYGNLIIETKSSEKPYKPGWAITSKADVLIWYLWHLNEALYFRMNTITSMVDWWRGLYGETARIPNKNYVTVGIKLPLKNARHFAFASRKPIDPYWMKANYKEWVNK